MSKRRVTVFDNRKPEDAKVTADSARHARLSSAASAVSANDARACLSLTCCFPSCPQILNISPGTSLAEFLKLASAKLGGFSSSAPAKKAYLQDGGAIEDAEIIRDNDLVYVSAGEAFYKLNQSASSSSSQWTTRTQRSGTRDERASEHAYERRPCNVEPCTSRGNQAGECGESVCRV